MPAVITSTFNIVVDETIAAGTSVTVTNPGRSFKVLSVLVTGLNNGVMTVTRSIGGTVSATTLATGDLNDFPSLLTVVNINIEDTTDLVFAATVANISRVVVVCGARNPYDLTVT
jgi:hypothetical protein